MGWHNRDEDAFVHSDKFDAHLKWAEEEPLGFGFNPHRCTVEKMAKAELSTLLDKRAK
jgi:cytochrome P450